MDYNDSDFVWNSAFRLFDKNSDGGITYDEAWSTLRNSAVEINAEITDNMTTRQFFEAARILYGRADMNNDRMIKKSEFKDLYKKVHPKSDWRRWNQNTWNMMFD